MMMSGMNTCFGNTNYSAAQPEQFSGLQISNTLQFDSKENGSTVTQPMFGVENVVFNGVFNNNNINNRNNHNITPRTNNNIDVSNSLYHQNKIATNGNNYNIPQPNDKQFHSELFNVQSINSEHSKNNNFKVNNYKNNNIISNNVMKSNGSAGSLFEYNANNVSNSRIHNNYMSMPELTSNANNFQVDNRFANSHSLQSLGTTTPLTQSYPCSANIANSFIAHGANALPSAKSTPEFTSPPMSGTASPPAYAIPIAHNLESRRHLVETPLSNISAQSNFSGSLSTTTTTTINNISNNNNSNSFKNNNFINQNNNLNIILPGLPYNNNNNINTTNLNIYNHHNSINNSSSNNSNMNYNNNSKSNSVMFSDVFSTNAISAPQIFSAISTFNHNTQTTSVDNRFNNNLIYNNSYNNNINNNSNVNNNSSSSCSSQQYCSEKQQEELMQEKNKINCDKPANITVPASSCEEEHSQEHNATTEEDDKIDELLFIMQRLEAHTPDAMENSQSRSISMHCEPIEETNSEFEWQYYESDVDELPLEINSASHTNMIDINEQDNKQDSLNNINNNNNICSTTPDKWKEDNCDAKAVCYSAPLTNISASEAIEHKLLEQHQKHHEEQEEEQEHPQELLTINADAILHALPNASASIDAVMSTFTNNTNAQNELANNIVMKTTANVALSANKENERVRCLSERKSENVQEELMGEKDTPLATRLQINTIDELTNNNNIITNNKQNTNIPASNSMKVANVHEHSDEKIAADHHTSIEQNKKDDHQECSLEELVSKLYNENEYQHEEQINVNSSAHVNVKEQKQIIRNATTTTTDYENLHSNKENKNVDAVNIHSSLAPVQRINKSPATAAFDLRSLLAKRTWLAEKPTKELQTTNEMNQKSEDASDKIIEATNFSPIAPLHTKSESSTSESTLTTTTTKESRSSGAPKIYTAAEIERALIEQSSSQNKSQKADLFAQERLQSSNEEITSVTNQRPVSTSVSSLIHSHEHSPEDDFMVKVNRESNQNNNYDDDDANRKSKYYRANEEEQEKLEETHSDKNNSNNDKSIDTNKRTNYQKSSSAPTNFKKNKVKVYKNYSANDASVGSNEYDESYRYYFSKQHHRNNVHGEYSQHNNSHKYSNSGYYHYNNNDVHEDEGNVDEDYDYDDDNNDYNIVNKNYSNYHNSNSSNSYNTRSNYYYNRSNNYNSRYRNRYNVHHRIDNDDEYEQYNEEPTHEIENDPTLPKYTRRAKYTKPFFNNNNNNNSTINKYDKNVNKNNISSSGSSNMNYSKSKSKYYSYDTNNNNKNNNKNKNYYFYSYDEDNKEANNSFASSNVDQQYEYYSEPEQREMVCELLEQRGRALSDESSLSSYSSDNEDQEHHRHHHHHDRYHNNKDDNTDASEERQGRHKRNAFEPFCITRSNVLNPFRHSTRSLQRLQAINAQNKCDGFALETSELWPPRHAKQVEELLTQAKAHKLLRHLKIVTFARQHVEEIQELFNKWWEKGIPALDACFGAYYYYVQEKSGKSLCLKQNGRGSSSGVGYGKCDFEERHPNTTCKYEHVCLFCRSSTHGWFDEDKCEAYQQMLSELSSLRVSRRELNTLADAMEKSDIVKVCFPVSSDN